MAEANVQKLQSRIVSMERNRKKTAKRTEAELRRVQARENEQSAAASECRDQLSQMEESVARVTEDLKSMQSRNEILGKDFATQSGQLEAARKREVAAHEGQAELARNMTTSMEQGDTATQMRAQFKTMQEQKAADDKDVEIKTVQLRELTAQARDAGQREETTRTELTTKIEQLEAVIKTLNGKSQRQQEAQKDERAVAISNQEIADAEVATLQQQADVWETKYNTLREQHMKVKMVCSLATQEIQDLKDQRLQVQQELAQQLKDQEQASAQAATEAAKLQKMIDLDAAELSNQEKMAKKDVKKAQDTDKFHQKQLQKTITDKIQQVEGLNDLVKQLQTELAKQKQLRSEQEAEVARVNKTVANDGRTIATIKEDAAGLKHQVYEKNEESKKQAGEITKMKAKVDELNTLVQQQANDQQTQLDDERNRANEAEEMRADSDAKLKSVEKSLLDARRSLDDLNGQHNTALSQIGTLERRTKLQNAASTAVAAVTETALADKTKIAALEEVEIEKLKADYKEIHTFLNGALDDLRKARAEQEASTKRIAYQDQELSTAKTMSDKKITELKSALETAKGNEKQTAAKLATTGQELMTKTEQHAKEALAARTNGENAAALETKFGLADAALKKAEERVEQLEVVESQSNIKVAEGLREVAGLEEKLAGMTKARDDIDGQLQTTTADLRNEQKLHKVTTAKLGTTGADLAVALAIQPALDETARKLEKTENEFAQTKELAAVTAAAAAAAAATILENEKTKAASEYSTMKESLTTDLANTKTTMAAEHKSTRDTLTQKITEIEERTASEFATMKDSLTTELDETKTKMAADHKATRDELTAKIKSIEERAASEFDSMKKSLTDELAQQKQKMTTEHAKTVRVPTYYSSLLRVL